MLVMLLNLRELVLTYVILAPGACGRGVWAAAPAAFPRDPLNPRDPVTNSKLLQIRMERKQAF